jgi:hypothetical protein
MLVDALSEAAAEVSSSLGTIIVSNSSNPQSPQQQRATRASTSSSPWGPSHSSGSGWDERNERRKDGKKKTTAGDGEGGGSSSRGVATNPQGDGGGGSLSASSSSQQEREGPASSLTTAERAAPYRDEEERAGAQDGAASRPSRRRGRSGGIGSANVIDEWWERAGSISRKLSFDYLEQACMVVNCQSQGAQATKSAPGMAVAEAGGLQRTSNITSAPPDELAQAKQWALGASLNTNQEATGSNKTSPPFPTQNAKKMTTNSTVTTNAHPVVRQHDEIEVLPNHRVQVRLPPTHPAEASNKHKAANSKGAGSFPVDTLVLNVCNHLERNISELTMRSSYAATCESLNKLPDNRRMAYYAVGKHHRNVSTAGSNASHPLAAQLNRTGCNRRCYFTGKLILGGAVFYAGTVQQGLRTLVVFCLPYALGLPDKGACKNAPARTVTSAYSNASSTASPRHISLGGWFPGRPSEPSRSSSKNSGAAAGSSSASQPNHQQQTRGRTLSSNNTVANHSVANYSTISNQQSLRSRFSNSLDGDLSTIDCDLDPNWGLDPAFLLKVLPEAGPELVSQMSRLYPEQFATLPLQVRDPARWRLYVKFCFFSGLPIADGEMHYKVLDPIAELVYDGEEITLSHEVMEAVNGSESAEILTLPNQKAFRYLRKHYAQQCAKLDDRVFRRDSWERVAPEV